MYVQKQKTSFVSSSPHKKGAGSRPSPKEVQSELLGGRAIMACGSGFPVMSRNDHIPVEMGIPVAPTSGRSGIAAMDLGIDAIGESARITDARATITTIAAIAAIF